MQLPVGVGACDPTGYRHIGGPDVGRRGQVPAYAGFGDGLDPDTEVIQAPDADVLPDSGLGFGSYPGWNAA